MLWPEQRVFEPILEFTESTVWLEDLRRPKALCSEEEEREWKLAGGEQVEL